MPAKAAVDCLVLCLLLRAPEEANRGIQEPRVFVALVSISSLMALVEPLSLLMALAVPLSSLQALLMTPVLLAVVLSQCFLTCTFL